MQKSPNARIQTAKKISKGLVKSITKRAQSSCPRSSKKK